MRLAARASPPLHGNDLVNDTSPPVSVSQIAVRVASRRLTSRMIRAVPVERLRFVSE